MEIKKIGYVALGTIVGWTASGVFDRVFEEELDRLVWNLEKGKERIVETVQVITDSVMRDFHNPYGDGEAFRHFTYEPIHFDEATATTSIGSAMFVSLTDSNLSGDIGTDAPSINFTGGVNPI